jgi:hypothetical protein
MDLNVIHWPLLGHLLFADMVEDEPSEVEEVEGVVS